MSVVVWCILTQSKMFLNCYKRCFTVPTTKTGTQNRDRPKIGFVFGAENADF